MPTAAMSDLAERVARACRVLARLDLTKAALGHVSARIPGEDRILIRARGPGELGVRYTTDDQVIVVDLEGRLIEENTKGLVAPLEVFIHTEIYKVRPDVHSVVHLHPSNVVLFTICNKPLLPIFGSYDPLSARFALEHVPRFDRAFLINSRERGVAFAREVGAAKVCLMRGHGITTAGTSIEQASLYAIQINELATMNYQAALLGEPQVICEEDQQEVLSLLSKLSPSTDGGPPAGGDAAIWKYYCTVTNADE